MDNRELSWVPQFSRVASLLQVLLGTLGSFAADPVRSLGFRDCLGSSWDSLCWVLVPALWHCAPVRKLRHTGVSWPQGQSKCQDPSCPGPHCSVPD